MHAMHHPHHHPFAAWGGRPHGAEHDRAEHDHEHDGRFRPPRWFAMAGPRPGPGADGPGHGPGRGRGGPFGGGFGPPRGGPFAGGRGGGRARRGDVRAAILRLLAEQPMHGYQVIQELSERSGGAWNPSPGSVYPTLAALEDQGLVRAEEVEGRRTFRLTDTGTAEAERLGGSAAPWDEVAAGGGAGFADLRDVTMGVMGAARQVASAGTAGQVERAVALLRETRRKLYQLLAEDEPTEPGAG